jgi:hypothetical protein
MTGAEGKLISGSVDTTIRVWSVQQPTCENVLQGHTDWVRKVHLVHVEESTSDVCVRTVFVFMTCRDRHVYPHDVYEKRSGAVLTAPCFCLLMFIHLDGRSMLTCERRQ